MIPCEDKDYLKDGLVNVVSGLGTAKAKRSHNQWTYGAMNDWASWDACYQSNWIARAIVDEWAADASREWRTIKSDGAEDITVVEDSLNVCQVVEEAIAWSRLFGGAGVVMITNQDLEKPLNLNRIRKGDLQRLEVFDRYDLTPSGDINNYDMLARNYLRSNYFTVNGGGQRIHYSHIAFFNGARLPKRMARMNNGWGDSELRRCIDEISDMVAAKDGVAELLQEVNVDVITREGLTDDLSTDQDEAILKRYQLFSQMKSVIQMALLDGDEKLDRQTLQLGGVSNILETMMVWISGAARMPVTKVFGKAASGLNATGEYDSKNYHDSIRSKQQGDISSGLRTIDEVMVRSALGRFPDSFDYEWNPLAQLNGLEVAQERYLIMQKHSLAMQENVATRAQVMRELQSNEDYQYDDDQLDQIEELEESTLFDEPLPNEPEPIDPMETGDTDFNDYVRKCDGKWCVYSKSGKKLGEHDTEEEANKQLRAIEANK